MVSYNVTTNKNELAKPKNKYFHKQKCITDIMNKQRMNLPNYQKDYKETISKFGSFKKTNSNFSREFETANRLGISRNPFGTIRKIN